MMTDTTELRRLYFLKQDQINPDTGIAILERLLQGAIAENDIWLTGNVLLKTGEYYIAKGNYVQALNCMTRACPYIDTLDYMESANCFQHIGWVYAELGDYITASQNYYIALGYLKRAGFNGTGSVSICNDLGEVFFKLHQNEKALYYCSLGEEIANRNNFKNCIAFILFNKGEYYTSIHKLDSARILFNRVDDIGTRLDKPYLKAIAHKGIGATFIESGDYDKAVGHLQSAMAISESKHKSAWIESSFLLGKVWLKLGKYKNAETILLSALKEATARNIKRNTVDGYATLADVYAATGQYIKALDCKNITMALKDSLESAERTKAIYLMDVKHQTAEKDKQIAESKLLLARKNSEMAHKNMWMLIVGGGVLLLLLLSVGAYLHMLNKKNALEKENKISVLKAAIQGGDDERRRIARELHDGIGGMLSAAMMRFSSLHNRASGANETAGYTEAMEILHEMGDEIRKTAHNLMPEVLVKQSLPEAIRTYCNCVRVNGALQISFQHYGSFDDLSQDYKLNVYRIVQELVKNVIQHAHAKRALVQLMRNEEVMIVCVEDDGKGFDKKEVKTGQGLYNTQTRVNSFDGHFTIESNPGKGTSVFIEFKMNKSGTVSDKNEALRTTHLSENMARLI